MEECDDAEHEHADAPDNCSKYRLVGGDAHDQVAHPSRVVAVGVALPSQDGFEQQPGGADAGGDGCGELDDEPDERGLGQFAESGQSFQRQQDAEEEPDADGTDEVAQEHRRRPRRNDGRAASGVPGEPAVTSPSKSTRAGHGNRVCPGKQRILGCLGSAIGFRR